MSLEVWGDPPEPPEMVTCPDCDGSGELQEVIDGLLQVMECPTCHGEGEIEQPDMRFDDDAI